MTSFTDTALSVFNTRPVAHPGRLLKALPEIVRHFLPHARYSSFLEILVAGAHPSHASAHKTPSLAISEEIGSKNSTTEANADGSSKSKANSNTLPDDLVFRILYKPHGKFAWMNGQIIENVKVLKWLGGEYLADAGYV
jgi:hypothetical protein